MKIDRGIVVMCVMFVAIFVSKAIEANNDIINPQVIQSFKSDAVEHMSSGQYRDAMNSLAHVLLLNPDDKFAQDKLIELKDSAHLSTKENIELTLINDLMEYASQLKDRMTRVEDIRNEIGRDLIDAGYDLELLEAEMNIIKDSVINSDRVTDLENQLEAINKEEGPLDVLKASLNFEIEHLSDKLVYYDMQHERLKELVLEQEQQPQAEEQIVKVANVYDDSQGVSIADMALLATEEADEDLKQNFSIPPTPKMNQNPADMTPENLLNRKFGALRSELDSLQAIMAAKDVKIEALKREVVDLTIVVAEKDTHLKDKEERLASLKGELTDLQAQFDMSQKTIQEKNMQIDTKNIEIQDLKTEQKSLMVRNDNLESEVAKLESQYAMSQQIIGEKDGLIEQQGLEIVALKEKQTELVDQKRQLQTQLSQTQSSVEELNGMLSLYKGRLGDKQKDLDNKSLQTAALREEVRELKKLKPLKDIVRLREQEIRDLNDILGWYKDNLDQAQTGLSDRDQRIRRLSKEVSSLRKAFQEQDSKMNQQRRQMFTLKDALKNEKLKREQRNINLRNVVLERDNEISRLNEQIKSSILQADQANERLLEKNANVSTLEEQLTYAQTQLLLKDEAMQEKNGHILTLEEQIKAVQQRLVSLQSTAQPNDDEEKVDLEQEILQLQNKLNEIQFFLQKELSPINDMNVKKDLYSDNVSLAP